jgi:hypothetical protein
MKIKNYKEWKTTLLGMIIIVASITSVFIKEIQWSDASFGIAVGLVLVFSPDTIITSLKKFMK